MRGLHELRDRYYRWMYRGKRPNWWARWQNRLSASQFSKGWFLRERVAALEVRGRRTGRIISFPVAIADYAGERYLVAMLGENVNWVRNLRAAKGRAVLRHGRVESVRLEEVAPGARAPILRRYLEIAPGARPHVPVDRRAPLAEFERIAPRFPVFQVCSGLGNASPPGALNDGAGTDHTT
ncbi:nitroreductase family deazaflavin-dependent oxidoreductase [Lentzea sp. NPDC102401]|uniref:nitroreductase family deazaflavin-dependent oxidoreductase n=1 Tax=Lentzea sp. NPDC102401 TaxID=3364128 RepID=UPI003825537A